MFYVATVISTGAKYRMGFDLNDVMMFSDNAENETTIVRHKDGTWFTIDVHFDVFYQLMCSFQAKKARSAE